MLICLFGPLSFRENHFLGSSGPSSLCKSLHSYDSLLCLMYRPLCSLGLLNTGTTSIVARYPTSAPPRPNNDALLLWFLVGPTVYKQYNYSVLHTRRCMWNYCAVHPTWIQLHVVSHLRLARIPLAAAFLRILGRSAAVICAGWWFPVKFTRRSTFRMSKSHWSLGSRNLACGGMADKGCVVPCAL